MSARYTEKWLLVEYGNDTKGIIHSRYIMDKENVNLRLGSSLIIRKRGEQQLVTLIKTSNRRPLLQHLLDTKNCSVAPEKTRDYSGVAPQDPRDYFGLAPEEPRDYSSVAPDDTCDFSGVALEESRDFCGVAIEEPHDYSGVAPEEPRDYSGIALEEPRDYSGVAPEEPRDYSGVPPEEPRDYSSSSSWVPSDDDDSESEVEHMKSTLNKEHIAMSAMRNKRVQKHNGINAVQPASRRIPSKGLNKFVTSRRRRNNVIKSNKRAYNVSKAVVQYRVEPNILHLKINLNKISNQKTLKTVIGNIMSTVKFNIGKVNLINKNRFKTEEELQPAARDRRQIVNQNDEDWVPIGSGKTMIPKETFRKIKWKSYTIATRTLMLAVFPRRTLATHSLTGKRSPAFQDKPAKMCLDPKKVSDIISEVMDRFDVTENRVRSIITTKCADEAKMYRMRLKKRNDTLPNTEETPSIMTPEMTEDDQTTE